MKRINLLATQTFFKRILFLSVAILLLPTLVFAQEGEGFNLELTGIDVSTLPVLSLRIVGSTADGRAIDFNQNQLEIQHGAEVIPQEQFQSIETERVGTFTLVLLDTPAGVVGEIENIQEAIRVYADNGEATYMSEPNDYLGIYAVDFSDPKTLLEPTFFRNGVINWLAEDLPISEGATALYDSLDSLLGQINGIKPSDEMVASIIVMTDGTDSVSTRVDQLGVIQKAIDSNVIVHTVHLNNTAIFSADEGRSFLADLSRRTGGFTTEMNVEGVQQLWESVGSFSQQTVISYRPTDPTPGNVPITVRLRDFPRVEALTSAQFPADQLQVELQLVNLEPNLIMPDPAAPVELSLPVAITWLDGRDRTVSTAQLLLNGNLAAEVPVSEEGLSSADVSVSGMKYGPNDVVLTVMDENGNRGNSQTLVLNVAPGDQLTIPDALQSSSARFGGTWLFLVIGLLVLLGIIGYWLMTSGSQFKLADVFTSAFSTTPRRRTRRDSLEIERASISDMSADETVVAAGPPSGAQSVYWLDVIDADNTDPTAFPIIGLEQRIGRSASKSDIAFTNEQTVSRVHATLAREGNTYRLYDEQSTSGTFLNGQRLPEYGALLNDGDEVQMGALVLRFRREA